MEPILHALVAGRTLDESQAEDAFDAIFEGRANEVQVGAMLALIARRGPTVDELVGGARAMRRRAVRIPTDGLERVGSVVDTCGTGGALKTFNISTAAALVAAGARGRTRALVAKHGGRSRSGRGSAEVLERLGVRVDAPAHVQRRCLEEAGVCFAFAVHHHPAMKFAASPRKSLGFPTIFNLLGPLTNPAGARRQLMGVYDRACQQLVGEAFARLGCDRAWIVHGGDGLDEITTTGPTDIVEVQGADVRQRTFDPASLSVPRASAADLRQASTLEAAAELLARLLDPGAPQSTALARARDIVILNAAGAIHVAGGAPDMREAAELARASIENGRAREALRVLCKISNERS